MSVSFSGNWEGVQARLEELQRRLSVGDQSVKAGVLGSEGSDLVMIAATMEYGSPSKNIPARAFMRKSLASRRLVSNVRNIAARYFAGKIDLDRALNQVGISAVGVIQQAIGSNIAPPNAPATIARKGSSATLIDTGRLRQSISYEIVSGPGTAVSTAKAGKSKNQKRSEKAVRSFNRASSRLQKRGKRAAKQVKRTTVKVTKQVRRTAKKAVKRTKKAAKQARKVSRRVLRRII